MNLSWLSLDLTGPRIIGRPRHGLLLLALGAGTIAGCVALVVFWPGRAVPGSVIVALLVATSSIAAGVGALGAFEVLRPVWLGADGRGHSRRIEDAALRWHPRIAGVVDEFRRSTDLCEPTIGPGLVGMIVGGVRAALAGRVRARLVLEESPLRTGTRARLMFQAEPSRGTPSAMQPRFRLRCWRERARGLFPVRECLDVLAPQDVGTKVLERSVRWTLEFRLPERLPASDLLAGEPIYWQLTVEIDGLAHPYREEFYLPVAH